MTLRRPRLPIDGEKFSRAFLMVWSVGCARGREGNAIVTGRKPKQEEFEELTWALAEQGSAVSAATYLLTVTFLQAVARQVARFLTKYDVWLTPTLADPPLPLGSFRPAARRSALWFAPRRRLCALHAHLQRDRPASDVGASILERRRAAGGHAFHGALRRRSHAVPAGIAARSGAPLVGSAPEGVVSGATTIRTTLPGRYRMARTNRSRRVRFLAGSERRLDRNRRGAWRDDCPLVAPREPRGGGRVGRQAPARSARAGDTPRQRHRRLRRRALP